MNGGQLAGVETLGAHLKENTSKQMYREKGVWNGQVEDPVEVSYHVVNVGEEKLFLVAVVCAGFL